MAISCISASSWSAYACSKASLGGRALLCHLAMADVILRLGPNNLREERREGFRILMLWRSKLWRRGSQIPYVIPISLRSFSVRVRNIRRSMSCSSSKERYLAKPICSRNSARSCGDGNTEVITGQRSESLRRHIKKHGQNLWSSVGRWESSR